MGVKNLIKLIEKLAPNAITYKRIQNYNNTIIGIDTNLMIYKLIYGIRGMGIDITNKINDKDIIVTHIHALLMKFIGFRKYNIRPVFVFDVASPDIKEATMEDRKKVREKLAEKYKDSKTDKGKRIYYYMKSDVTQEEIDDIRELINIFNYPLIDAKEEADSQLTQLAKNNLIDYIASDDMDILVFGTSNVKLLKKFNVDEDKTIQEINLSKFLKSAKITHKELIDIAILCGSDYCKIPSVSPLKSYALIKEYKSIINIPEISHKCDEAREYFSHPPVFNIKKLPTRKKPDVEKFKAFLNRFHFKQKYIKRMLKDLKLD